MNLQQYAASIKVREREDGTRMLYDVIRKKYVISQPEELVRQCCIHYLIEELGYPKSKIQVEKAIKIFGVSRRFDIIAFNKESDLDLLIECKSFNFKLNHDVAQQIALYNLKCQSKHLWITNGEDNYCFKFEVNSYNRIDQLPSYK